MNYDVNYQLSIYNADGKLHDEFSGSWETACTDAHSLKDFRDDHARPDTAAMFSVVTLADKSFDGRVLDAISVCSNGGAIELTFSSSSAFGELSFKKRLPLN